MKVWRFLAAAAAATVALQWPAGAQQPVPQYRIQPLTDLTGAPALSLALRKLSDDRYGRPHDRAPRR